MKKLIIIVLLVSGVLQAMDVTPDITQHKKCSIKTLLSKKEFNKHLRTLKSPKQLKKETKKDLFLPQEVQNKIAFHMLAPVIDSIKNKQRCMSNGISCLPKVSKFSRYQILFSQDGKRVIVNSFTGPFDYFPHLGKKECSVAVLDIKKWAKIHTFHATMGIRLTVALSKDGSQCAFFKPRISYAPGNFTKKNKHVILSKEVRMHCQNDKKKKKLSVGDSVVVYDMRSGKKVYIAKKDDFKLKKPFVFNHDINGVVTGEGDKNFSRLWNIEHWRNFNRCLEGDRELILSTDRKVMVDRTCVDSEWNINIWDMEKQKILYNFNQGRRGYPKYLSADGSTLATVKSIDVNDFPQYHEIILVHIKHKKMVTIHIAQRHVNSNCMALNADGSKVAAFFADDSYKKSYLRIWDTYTGKLIMEFEYTRGYTINSSPRSIAFSPDGNIIAAVFDTGAVRLWHVGEQKNVLQWLKSNVLPDQAEIICKMYEAHQKGKRLKVNMNDAVRFSKMPDHVKKLLYMYFGRLKQKKVDNRNKAIS